MTLHEAILEFPRQVMLATDLADLPAERRRNLRENLQDLLLERLTNILLAEADDETLVAADECGSLEEALDFLLAKVPYTEEILGEEIEIFFQELTSEK